VTEMRVIVVGLGVQGNKRRRIAGDDLVATIDPLNSEADFKSLSDVALESFDAALCCVPDEPKVSMVDYLLTNGKHVLVEKPLWASNSADIEKLQTLAKANNVVCYTAYNHRFEPHFVRMREVIASGKLGQIYTIRIFYGNGTARLVRDSEWRDKGAGVLADLGSHLLDTLLFWTGERRDNFQLQSANRFENRAFDHMALASHGRPLLQLEMTLLMWRNHFYADVLAENGSAHITSLCKWGPSQFILRDRKLPSGRPDEESVILVQSDPTWAAEYAHFKTLIAEGERPSLENDLWIHETLSFLSRQAAVEASAGADP